MRVFVFIALVLASASVFAAGADEASNFGNFTYDFKSLPLKGEMNRGTKAWSGDYWAFRYGGINLRWNTSDPVGYNLRSPERSEVVQMTEAQLAQLAPSEKWAFFQGDYEYSFVDEVASFNGPHKKVWAGICHGWAAASLHHEEPTPKVLVSKDGVRVPFGSGDIKAIMSYFYADQQETAEQIGSKCTIARWVGAGGCGGDINPGALHVVMANMMGLQKEGFLMDRDPGKEVWNQPVTGFESKLVSALRKTSAGYAVDVETKLFWTDESKPTWNLVYKTENNKTSIMELAYTLELDQNYKIVDGSWGNDTEYPDFIWITPKISVYQDKWAGFEQLLND